VSKQCVALGTVLAVALWCALSIGVACAQDPYPTKPVKIVVPFTPGTGIDILARTLGQKMGDDWKQAVVVENKPGAAETSAPKPWPSRRPMAHAADDREHDRAQPQPVRFRFRTTPSRISPRSHHLPSDSLRWWCIPI
jgi:hypothetical protein